MVCLSEESEKLFWLLRYGNSFSSINPKLLEERVY